MGFDPGTRKTGYCVLAVGGGAHKNKILEWGCWNVGARPSLGDRLEKLYTEASALLRRWNPQVVGIEKAVVFKNIPSSLTLSEARGVLRLAVHSQLAEAAARIVELSPTLVKKSNTGRGTASKEDIKLHLKLRWGFDFTLKEFSSLSFDAFDALAIATSASLLHSRRTFREACATK